MIYLYTQIALLIREGQYDEVVELLKKSIEEQIPPQQAINKAQILKELGERLITESEAIEQTHKYDVSIKEKTDRKRKNAEEWRIECFGKMRFLRPDREIQNIHWKRKKAEELFTYLLLQPHYAAPKDATAELLFHHDDFNLMSNQLYVAIHQIKRNLAEYLQIPNGITIKNGMIQLNEEMIDHVDVERYNTLVRVGDQLWQSQKDLSSELYDEAQQLYGELVPTLQYVDWLDQYRDALLKKQTGILKRLGTYSVSINELGRAELYYLEWIRLSPYEEEAYQELMKLLLKMGRLGAAKQWYQRMEKLFHEELGIRPLRETNAILSGGSH